MKTMRKLFAMVLALTMVLAMATTANAVDITINNAQDGATYDVYQLLTKVYNSDKSSFSYKATNAWKDFWAGESMKEYVVVYSDDVVSKTDKYDAAAVAQLAAAYAKDLTPDYEDVTTEITGAAEGYYLLTTPNEGVASLAPIDSDSTTLRVKDKTLPTIEKEMAELGTDYKVGDIGDFTITVTLDEGKDAYTIHDKMTGLELVGDITVAAPIRATATPSTTTDDGCSFHVSVSFPDDELSKAYETITITYQAKVTEAGVDKIENQSWVNDGTPDVVDEETESFNLKKTDASGNELAGAEFELYVANGDNKDLVPVVYIEDANGDYYRPANGTTEAAAAVKITAGEATIKGLDSEKTYYLKETKAPDGYVMQDGYISVTFDTTVTVKNTKGEELPETGGMGTTLFYIVGGLMVAGAAILLVTKKRMGAAE